MPRLSEIINVNDEIVFGGAVQAEWFYQDKAAEISRNFVFHGPDFFGVTEKDIEFKDHTLLDTCSYVNMIADRLYSDIGKSIIMTIAGYGTGKSHLAVTIGKYFENHDLNIVEVVSENIRKADKGIAAELKKKHTRKNLVFILNGMRDFNLNSEILNTAKKLLNQYGYSEEFFADFTKAYTIAATFVERNFDLYEKRFLEEAQSKGIEAPFLKTYLLENIYSDEVFNLINSVYSHVTSTTIRWDEGITASDILRKLEDKLCGENGEFNKILILFDEFGRYIEFVADRPELAGDSALQQIYEAIQDSNRNILFVGLIQSDLKTYMARVKKSSNVSRYIGRYETGEKVYLSCNLETIFANLIIRDNPAYFEEYINNYFNRIDTLNNSDVLYRDINEWCSSLSNRGVWNNPEKFSSVILKGIYPFHPITILLLTELSDWYQQRSALNFFLNTFKKVQNIEISKYGVLPYVRPVDIIKGDFFEELLLAEKEGRQRSENCLLYERLITKYGEKLEKHEADIIASILIYKLLKFKTSTIESLITSMVYMTGLNDLSIKKSLYELESNQGIIVYDEKRNAYDFVEDAFGLNDFKVFINRMKNRVGNPQIELLINSDIKDKLNLNAQIETDFAVKNNIKTSEWQFEQDLLTLAEVNEVFISNLVKDFENKTAPDKAKGRYIYVYISESESAERLCELYRSFNLDKYPFVFMMIDDSNGEFYDSLLNERIIREISDEDMAKYGRFTIKYISENSEDLKSTFRKLQERKEFLTVNGIEQNNKRLKQICTDAFLSLYSKAIPFAFEGFGNKQLSIPKKSLCLIAKSILSGMVGYQWMQSQGIDVKNKVDAVLINRNVGWGVLNEDLAFIHPMNKAVHEIFTDIDGLFFCEDKVDLYVLYRKYTSIPYGLNDYSFALMIAVYIQMKGVEAKIETDGQIVKNSEWSNLFYSEKGLNLDFIKNSKLKRINIEGYYAKFQVLCSEIEHNKDIELFSSLEDKLTGLLLESDPPEELKVKVDACKMRLSMGNDHFNKINREVYAIQGGFNEGTSNHEYKKLLPAMLGALELLQNQDDSSIFEMSHKHKSMLQRILIDGKSFVESNYLSDLKSFKCQSITQVGPYKSFMEKLENNLKALSFYDFASKTKGQAEQILSNLDHIKKVQMIEETFNSFIRTTKPDKHSTQDELLSWQKKITEIKGFIEENTALQDREKRRHLAELSRLDDEVANYLSAITTAITGVWDKAFDLQTVEDAKALKSEIMSLIERGIRAEDKNAIEPIGHILADCLNDFGELNSHVELSQRLHRIPLLFDKYKAYEDDVNLSEVIRNYKATVENKMQQENELWIKRFHWVEEDDIDHWDSQKCHSFKQDTDILPSFLYEGNIVKINDYRVSVEKRIKEIKIESIALLFKQLTNIEKRQCIDLLQESMGGE